jgi:hypothetical protein
MIIVINIIILKIAFVNRLFKIDVTASESCLFDTGKAIFRVDGYFNA